MKEKKGKRLERVSRYIEIKVEHYFLLSPTKTEEKSFANIYEWEGFSVLVQAKMKRLQKFPPC
jgi:hypothetical protein